MKPFRASILTVSDTRTQENDYSGKILEQLLIEEEFSVVERKIVPDELNLIKKTLILWCHNVDLIITTGGTGLSSRDVTPEATKQIIEKEIPGIVIAIITNSIKLTNFAMLSRLTCGIRGCTLIVNFPGSSKACKECFEIIKVILKHAIDQLRNDKININKEHTALQNEVPNKISRNQESLIMIDDFVCRASPYPMLDIDVALNIIISTLKPLNNEIIHLNFSIGHRSAEDILSPLPLPPFRASIKDGYAIKVNKSLIREVVFKESDIIDPEKQCILVNTGNKIPDCFDAVIQVEDTAVKDKVLKMEIEPPIGTDIREKGCDMQKNELIIEKNTLIGPIEIGLMASVGMDYVKVFRKPKIAILSTGDELCEAGEPIKEWCIYDSNRPSLISLFKSKNLFIKDFGIVKDDRQQIKDLIKNALNECDILVTSGGVSMGTRDYLKNILQSLGAYIHFGRIKAKPGKPTTFATYEDNGQTKFIFCLPGNPVSSYVMALLLVIPACNILSGMSLEGIGSDGKYKVTDFHQSMKVRVKFPSKLDERVEFVRAQINLETKEGTITGNQRSSRLLSVKGANALIRLPAKNEKQNLIDEWCDCDAILI